MLLKFEHYIGRIGGRTIFAYFKIYKPFSLLVEEKAKKHREYKFWIIISKEISVSLTHIFASKIELAEGETSASSITKFKNGLFTIYVDNKYVISFE
jgi:hypothetical protein